MSSAVLSHSKSLKITLLSRAFEVTKAFYCNYVSILYHLWDI